MILESFFQFYLDGVKAENAERLLGLLPPGIDRSPAGLASIFRRDDEEAADFLLDFHHVMAGIRRDDPRDCIMFDDPQNVCYPFFIGYVLQRLSEIDRERLGMQFGSTEFEPIIDRLVNDREARNWFRENLSGSLRQEDLFALSEIIALVNLSSGGEYSFLNLVYPHIRNFSGQVLDAGCGMGFSSLMMSRYVDVVAVDACRSRLNRARALAREMKIRPQEKTDKILSLLEIEMGEMNREKRGMSLQEILEMPQKEISFLHSSLDNLALPGANFDGIVCLDVLEHTFDPDLVVGEFSRLIKPGGKVWVTVPNKNGGRVDRIEGHLRGSSFPAMLHLHHWDSVDLNRLFAAQGFEPLISENFDFVPAARMAAWREMFPDIEGWDYMDEEGAFLQVFAVFQKRGSL